MQTSRMQLSRIHENSTCKSYCLNLFLISFLELSFICASGQAIDTNKMLLSAKMSLVSFDNAYWGKEDIVGLIDSRVEYRFLKSSGFSDIIFFEIILPRNDTGNSLSMYLGSFNLSDTVLIFGYNKVNKDLYRLKG